MIALFLIRCLVPAEGVEQGQTLWIAAAWLVFATVRVWWMSRHESWHRPAWSWTDTGTALLVGGHCLSALLVVFLANGDRRAALNGCWEWLAVGATWFVLRDMLRTQSVRTGLSRALLVTIAVLSLMGFWQHFVWYPEQATKITDLISLSTRLEQGTPLSPLERKRYDELNAEIGSEVLTLDAGGRKVMLDRATFSVEPIGRFALANSFAALLIVGLFLALDAVVLSVRQRSGRVALLAACGLALVIFPCLLLTKSRTALAGTAIVLVWQALRLFARSGTWSRRWLWGLGAGALAFAVLLIALVVTGGLDLLVLTEAPKSLQYRLEYWQGTLGIISHHPLFGVGPGNFRQHYLQFKLPGSSEEILDPHNFLLDAWAQGGLLALAGVGLLTGAWIGRCCSTQASEINSSPHPRSFTLFAGGTLAFAIVYAEEWLLEGFSDGIVITLALGWLAAAFVLERTLPRAAAISRIAALSAGSALLIHLLGAGGLSMPAILQLWLFLLVMTEPVAAPDTGPVPKPAILKGVTLALFVLTAGCLWSGLLPVLGSTLLLERGRHAFVVQGNIRAAEQFFREAAAIDTLSPEPHHQLAMLTMKRWLQSPQDSALFEAAAEHQQQAIIRDPMAGKRQLLLGELWLARFQHDPQREYAEQAVTALERGVELYPEFPQLWAQLALALQAAGRPTHLAARKALDLDDLNRRQGHTDKWFSDELRKKIEIISAPPEPSL
ncbi:O-antigen ligase family protein [Planctomicrobium piriforme]|uniref:O-Antigen ligase n=1 Tax=Planctomicrobium piriforme TaxID=1576369 RepID=A0A1I3DJJ1_9PLAN|nr:O-antigen ligase family protein [Planctomicrobium piriforme]SFH86885.1 O-Antigen ligase [Planctomicrobium piriforme]